MLSFKVVTDLEEAKKWWEMFSPKLNVYDNWEFRASFHSHFNNPLHFIIGYETETPVGLLPLQKHFEGQYLEFFGGAYMEDNRIFLKPGFEQYTSEFFASITVPAKLDFILGTDEFTNALPIRDQKYTLQLTDYGDYEGYFINAFSSKTRANIKKQLAAITEADITVVTSRFSDIDQIFALNIATFGGESTFHFPKRQDQLRGILKLDETQSHLLSFMQNGQVVGASLMIQHGDYFAYLNAGSKAQEIPNLGTFIYFKNIELAFQLQAKMLDARAGSFNWKERLHFTPHRQHYFFNQA